MKVSLGLAPMEGVSDFAFRLWMSQTSSPASMGTPFIRLTANYPNPHNPPVAWCPELYSQAIKQAVNYRVIPQVMSPEEDYVLRISDDLLKRTDAIDLNCGCPSPKVVGRGSGSSLLRDPAMFHDFVDKLRSNLNDQQLSVKIRTGYQHDEDYRELIRALEGFNLKRLTIHGRTKEQRYTGKANWQHINFAGEVLRIPIVGSGDISDFQSFSERINRAPTVQGVIVGRGALRNPWIFTELRTQKPVEISLKTLYWSISSFAVLNHLFTFNIQALFDLVLEGIFQNACGIDEEAWQKLYFRVSEKAFGYGKYPEEADLSVSTMGRVKLLWNYLRSSLPEIFFNPLAMRSKSLKVFFEHLNHSAALCQKQDFPLHWNPEIDWLYAGEKKKSGFSPKRNRLPAFATMN